jgi:hypothetical protein
MSKLARVLALAAISLAAMTAVAQAHAADQTTSHAPGRPTADRQVETAWPERRVAAPQQATGDATVRRLLARERSSIPNETPARLPSPTPSAEPGGKAGWPIPALVVLVAILALVAGVAVGAVRHANPTQRARQTG